MRTYLYLDEHIMVTRPLLSSFAPTNICRSLRRPDPGPLVCLLTLLGPLPAASIPSLGSLTTPLADLLDILIGCVKESPPNKENQEGRYLLQQLSIMLSLNESTILETYSLVPHNSLTMIPPRSVPHLKSSDNRFKHYKVPVTNQRRQIRRLV